MPDRTEGGGIAAALTVTMGGTPYRLRCLTIGDAEAWQALTSKIVVGTVFDEGAPTSDLFASMMRAGTDSAVESLRAYDVDGVLGGVENMRRLMSPPELRAAMEVVMDAAVPFDADASRSVAMAFGGPTRMLAATLAMMLTERAQSLLPARSTRGRSRGSASDTTTSDAPGLPSSSSSDGHTPTNSNGATGTTDATPSLTA